MLPSIQYRYLVLRATVSLQLRSADFNILSALVRDRSLGSDPLSEHWDGSASVREYDVDVQEFSSGLFEENVRDSSCGLERVLDC